MVQSDEEPAADEAVLVGEAGSFEALFRADYRRVVGLAYVLTGSFSVAEELAMEAFEKALARWSTVGSLDVPGAWVRKVVANSAVSRRRRLAVQRRAAPRLETEARRREISDPADVAVWDAVRRLSHRQAQVIALFYVEGYSRREVAETLGVSEESVKTHLERARKRLEKELSDVDR